MTNLEWIKTFNVNEMSNFLDDTANTCNTCVLYSANGDCGEDCKEGQRLWLEAEHKEELKPCPFCGSYDIEAVPIQDGGGIIGGWRVKCFNCRSMTGMYNAKEEAINLWNGVTMND